MSSSRGMNSPSFTKRLSSSSKFGYDRDRDRDSVRDRDRDRDGVYNYNDRVSRRDSYGSVSGSMYDERDRMYNDREYSRRMRRESSMEDNRYDDPRDRYERDDRDDWDARSRRSQRQYDRDRDYRGGDDRRYYDSGPSYSRAHSRGRLGRHESSVYDGFEGKALAAKQIQKTYRGYRTRKVVYPEQKRVQRLVMQYADMFLDEFLMKRLVPDVILESLQAPHKELTPVTSEEHDMFVIMMEVMSEVVQEQAKAVSLEIGKDAVLKYLTVKKRENAPVDPLMPLLEEQVMNPAINDMCTLIARDVIKDMLAEYYLSSMTDDMLQQFMDPLIYRVSLSAMGEHYLTQMLDHIIGPEIDTFCEIVAEEALEDEDDGTDELSQAMIAMGRNGREDLQRLTEKVVDNEIIDILLASLSQGPDALTLSQYTDSVVEEMLVSLLQQQCLDVAAVNNSVTQNVPVAVAHRELTHTAAFGALLSELQDQMETVQPMDDDEEREFKKSIMDDQIAQALHERDKANLRDWLFTNSLADNPELGP
eukprot:GFYU01004851.1.p1 GENE.GFYU01004851.1~~GFYU01004851.1.p1  ORF type:complete len:533 (+),score=126.27 GFYU01004851.1:64-1662(+)